MARFAFARQARRLLASLLALALLPGLLSATWSVIAIDTRTGQVVIASATCVAQGRFPRFPAKGLMDIQAIVVPGVAVAAAQAGVDMTRANQELIYRELRAGTAPDRIIEMLSEDPDFESRQFGIVDLQGRCAGHSGSENGQASLAVADSIPASGSTSRCRATSWRRTTWCTWRSRRSSRRAAQWPTGSWPRWRPRTAAAGTLAAPASRNRCSITCRATGKTSHVAYILVAKPGRSGRGVVQRRRVFRSISTSPTRTSKRGENANPVVTLRMRYDRWKAGGRAGADRLVCGARSRR